MGGKAHYPFREGSVVAQLILLRALRSDRQLALETADAEEIEEIDRMIARLSDLLRKRKRGAWGKRLKAICSALESQQIESSR